MRKGWFENLTAKVTPRDARNAAGVVWAGHRTGRIFPNGCLLPACQDNSFVLKLVRERDADSIVDCFQSNDGRL
jgi:hypothetical protein